VACEQNPATSHLVNVEHTLALARDLAAQGAHVIFASTNLVFDGRASFMAPNAPVSPQTSYARQKAEVEAALLSTGGASILRISKVVETLRPLIESWAGDLLAQRVIHPFSDRACSPVRLDHVVSAFQLLGERRHAGLYQLGGARNITYAEIAFQLAAHMGAPADLVQPVHGPPISSGGPHTTMRSSDIFSDLLPSGGDITLTSLFRTFVAPAPRT